MRALDYLLTAPGRRRLWWDAVGLTTGKITFTYDGDLTITSPRCNRSARKAYRYGYNDPHIFAWLNCYLKPGMVVLDVGANVGLYGFFAAKRVGPNGRVFAFEADPDTARFLNEGARRSNLQNIETVVAAIGNENRTAKFCRAAGNRGASHIAQEDSATELKVPMITLDAFAREHGIRGVQFAKLDLEGFEPFALEGMQELLQRSDDCAILTEIDAKLLARYGKCPQGVRDILEPLGYRAHRVLSEGIEPMDWGSPRSDALWLR